VLIENPSHYLRRIGHDWSEIDFLCEIAKRTGCGLLLDVTNVFVSAGNLGFCARDYIDAVPGDPIAQVHLAGYSLDPQLRDSLRVDSHDAPASIDVLALYARLIRRIGPRPTLIERDGNVPAFEQLLAEARAVRRIAQDATGAMQAARGTA